MGVLGKLRNLGVTFPSFFYFEFLYLTIPKFENSELEISENTLIGFKLTRAGRKLGNLGNLGKGYSDVSFSEFSSTT